MAIPNPARVIHSGVVASTVDVGAFRLVQFLTTGVRQNHHVVLGDNMIYLDYNASAPPHPGLQEIIRDAGERYWANSESCHAEGRAVRNALELARIRCAAFLDCGFEQLVFTSGGSEANNLAVRGALAATGTCHIVAGAIEHSSVENTLLDAQKRGHSVTRVMPEKNGVVSMESVRNAITSKTRLVSIMTANNETGALQPVAEISALCRARRIVFHTDAVQAVGKIRVSFREIGCDLLTFSAHKFGGPHGIGGLVIRKHDLIAAQITGGHQEFGLRAGTSNAPSAIGLGWLCKQLTNNGAGFAETVREYRDDIERVIAALDPEGRILGKEAPRLANTTFFAPSKIDGTALVAELERRGFCVSSSSACDGGKSRVADLFADGRAGIRISLGRFTTEEEVSSFLNALSEIYAGI